MIDSIDLPALRRIGLTPAVLASLLNPDAQAADERPMRVTEVQRDRVRVHDGRDEHVAAVWPTLRLALQMAEQRLVVGDWVRVRLGVPGDDTGAWLTARVQPLNHLVRRDESGGRQPLVSNVDTALLVMGAGPDFNLRRLDRYLALVRLAGIEPVIVLSQADLCADVPGRLAAVRHHLGGRVAVLALDGRGAEAGQALAPWLGEGRTLVLLGSSGAGKSTLTNTLCGSAQATGGVRRGDGRGRHTTTTRSLHRCPGGACIIDTPGLRGLQLDADAAQIDTVFEDVTALAGRCRFRDCRHADEPGCAVRCALPPDRLLSYQKLQREASRHEQTVFDRHRLLAEWKRRGRSAKAVVRAKRGE